MIIRSRERQLERNQHCHKHSVKKIQKNTVTNKAQGCDPKGEAKSKIKYYRTLLKESKRAKKKRKKGKKNKGSFVQTVTVRGD